MWQRRMIPQERPTADLDGAPWRDADKGRRLSGALTSYRVLILIETGQKKNLAYVAGTVFSFVHILWGGFYQVPHDGERSTQSEAFAELLTAGQWWGWDTTWFRFTVVQTCLIWLV